MGLITPDFHANPHSATRGNNGATLTLENRAPEHPGNATHTSRLVKSRSNEGRLVSDTVPETDKTLDRGRSFVLVPDSRR